MTTRNLLFPVDPEVAIATAQGTDKRGRFWRGSRGLAEFAGQGEHPVGRFWSIELECGPAEQPGRLVDRAARSNLRPARRASRRRLVAVPSPGAIARSAGRRRPASSRPASTERSWAIRRSRNSCSESESFAYRTRPRIKRPRCRPSGTESKSSTRAATSSSAIRSRPLRAPAWSGTHPGPRESARTGGPSVAPPQRTAHPGTVRSLASRTEPSRKKSSASSLLSSTVR